MSHPFTYLKKEQVLIDDLKSIEHYSKDWTKQFMVRSQGVLFPESVEEVQQIIMTCNEHNLKLVPSGGRTGLSGGAVAHQGEWVLSLEKMNKILNFSKTDATIRVQAGVITKHLQEEALKHNLYFPVDFAATGSSQIGGNIATNAGGVHVVRYGNTRSWVRGLKVVTGEGKVLDLNRGLIKNNSGYDLLQLFIASEGSLGVICEAEILLCSPPQEKQVVLLGLSSLQNLIQTYNYTKENLPLLAFEMFTDLALSKVKKAHSLPDPLESPCPYYALIEVEISKSFDLEGLEEALENCFERGWAEDGALSSNSTQYENLWKYREWISESLAPLSPYKNDVSVKISKIPEFIEAIESTVLKEHKNLEVVVFGHIGDGNLHVNTLKPESMSLEDFVQKCEEVNQALFSEIQKIGGSISAEHGVGLLKKPYLHYSASAEEISYMKEIKKVFDPKGVLNPGKIFSLDGDDAKY